MNGVKRSNDGAVMKKCPFCGGEARFATDSHRFIECAKCGSSTEYCESEEETIEKWNTRTPVENVIERLEKDMKERIKTAYVTSDVFVDGQANGLEWAIEIIKEELM